MVLEYEFFKPTSSSYYLESSDEWDESGEEVEYEYEVDDKDIVRALANMLRVRGLSVKEQAMKVIEKVTLCDEFTDKEKESLYQYDDAVSFKSNEELVDWAIETLEKKGKDVTLYAVLDLVLGDIEYYADWQDIHDLAYIYFEDEAEKEFRYEY